MGSHRVVGLVLAVCAATSACGGEEPDSGLDWEPCLDEFECASLEVPNDHTQSDGLKRHVAVARARAGDPARRIGVLLYNLGGPGVEGVHTLSDFQSQLSSSTPELTARFDLVAFDVRGVGESSPRLSFLADETLERIRALDRTPDDEAERAEQDAVADEVLASAAELDARFASRVDTESVARDLDLLRDALGEDTLNYFGGSYGTVLGATYMTLFPGRVRSFVLDSAVMPVVERREIVRAQAEGFEQAFGDFVAWCESTETCALQARGSAVVETIDSLLESADQTPITVGERVLSGSDLLVALGVLLNGGARAWPFMAEAIDEVLGGDASTMLASADRYFGRTSDGTYGDDIVDANLAISALDAPPGLDRAEFDAFVEEEVLSPGPHFGAAIAAEVRLTVGWPFEMARPLPAIDASRAPPALVLAGLRDPATPARWGFELRDALANGSAVVTHDDSTHGQFQTSSCVRDLGVAFLLDPAALPSDASCPTE